MRCNSCGRQTNPDGACRHADCGAVVLSFGDHVARAREALAGTAQPDDLLPDPPVNRRLSAERREAGRAGVAATRRRLRRNDDDDGGVG